MLILYVQADRGFSQHKMSWADIFSYWPEAVVGFISWCVIVYFSIKTFEEFNIRKQRRRYKEEDDIGRKRPEESPEAEGKSGTAQSGVRVSTTRKRKLQKSVEHAKRELLSGGASGSDSKTGSSDGGSK